MKTKTLFLLTSILLTALSCQVEENEEVELQAQSETAPIQSAAAPVNIGHIDQLESAILGETRDIWVHIPTSAADNADRLYPVVFLLDGNAHFHSVTGMIRQLSMVNGNTVSPEMIVVGIPNTDRMRDLTPTHTEGTTGGGKAFLQFIETELIPYIEANYPVSSYRTFIGHSLGGLTVIDALFENPDTYDNYIAIDPSLWWDEQVLLKMSQSRLTELNFSGKSLFVAVANTMRGQNDVESVVNDTDESTLHIRSILEFSKLAETKTNNGLNFGWKYYDEDSHGSVPLIAEYDALRFLFDWHNRVELSDLLFNDESTPAAELLEVVNSHFATVSSHLEQEVLPQERFVDSWGKTFLSKERADAAYAFLSMNMSNYPQSYRVHESMGDYYVAQEDTASAISHFNQAIELGGSDDVRSKLDELQEAN